MKVNVKLKKVALLAAEEAGKILKNDFRKNSGVYFKKDGSPITDADLKADKVIAGIIKKNFPGHGIVSEESGGKIENEYTWIVDPLDGTSNYVIGVPMFSVAIVLLKEKKPILAVVFNPISNELFFAERGLGSFLNGKRIYVGRVSDLSKSLLYFNRGKDLMGGIKILTKIAPYFRTFRCYGAASLDICQVAAGRGEGFIIVKPAYWDVGAGVLIAEEAGGIATDSSGKKYDLGSSDLIITNRKIYTQLVKMIKQ